MFIKYKMIADKIIKTIAQVGSVITPTLFSSNFRIAPQDALEILEYGVQLGIFFNSSLPNNRMEGEYTLRQVILNNLEMDRYTEELISFNSFIEKLFGDINQRSRYTHFDQEEGELRDEVLLLLATKKRLEASELLAKFILKREFIFTTRDDLKSEMWIYKNGIYLPQGMSFIQEYCDKILSYAYTRHFANEVIEKIRVRSFIEADEFFAHNYPFEVPILDGILHITEKKVYPFTPNKVFFNKLPIHFNPSATCPKIAEHFETILRDKSDVQVMFELFGYTLLKENKLETAFMFVGDGRNGKSKTLELIKKFLGIENCSSLPINALTEDSFTLCELFGKMVNLAGDLSYHELKEVGVLKMLIGRDMMQAKRKFLRDLKFINYSKLIFACNELPRIYDMKDGFWTKWILLEFPYKFITQREMEEIPEEERGKFKLINPDIIQQISTPEELSGLLNQALEGLKRLLNKNKFSYSKGTQEVKELWIRKSDSFTAFCMDFIEEEFESRISKKELRRQYNLYTRTHKLRGTGDKSIRITLENMYGVSEDKQDFATGDRYWEGIKFKKLMPPMFTVEKIK